MMVVMCIINNNNKNLSIKMTSLEPFQGAFKTKVAKSAAVTQVSNNNNNNRSWPSKKN